MSIAVNPLDLIHTATHWNKPDPEPIVITNPYVSAILVILVLAFLVY